MSGSSHQGWTTASLEAVPRLDPQADTTPGLVLVYARSHATLPAIVALAGDQTTIGREPGNTLMLQEPAVSRWHARIDRVGEVCTILDTGSTNGVIVNGLRAERHVLQDHDVVRIGDAVFRYAARGIFAYGAYRLDGSIVDQARLVSHARDEAMLVGGWQVDAILDRVERVARTEISVIVTGESGTGKELVAREVHRRSQRRGAFQAINCAALPAQLIESELFGYRRGAFTGAAQDKTGLIRAAHTGTLFLDEIGDMPLEAQAKLLRVLQEREVVPVGATTAERVDVRVVAATHRNLEELVMQGRFRGDLLARLRELVVHLPSLRERREDLYPLLVHFLTKMGVHARPTFAFMLGVAHYTWPYNVRELESAVKLAAALAGHVPELDLHHLPEQVRRALDNHGAPRGHSGRPIPVAPGVPAAPAGLRAGGFGAEVPTSPRTPAPPHDPPGDAVDRWGTPSEADLRAMLARHRGNVAALGRELGKERMQIHRWMKRYGIDIEQYRE